MTKLGWVEGGMEVECKLNTGLRINVLMMTTRST